MTSYEERATPVGPLPDRPNCTGPALEGACVVAVIVTYFPDAATLQALLAESLRQCEAAVIVDNTPDGACLDLPAPLADRTTVLAQGANVGLAKALNIGIQRALAQGAEHVLLFDQDSLPADGMVDRLLAGLDAARRAGVRPGAAGPVFVDERGGEPPSFLRVGFPSNTAVPASAELPWVPTDVLITSGCLVTRECLEDAGLMREDLFIDNIDLEWGFRALAAGWHLIGVPQALLRHSIGDSRDELPLWLRRLTGRHSVLRYGAIRHYYIMRNRVLLYWMPHVPWRWKLQDFVRLPVKCVLIALATPADRRLPLIKAMARGLLDGMRRTSGPKP